MIGHLLVSYLPYHSHNCSDLSIFIIDQDNAQALLGTLDSAFLFAYAGAMFFSGFVAERVNLRYFLALGMIFSGIGSYLFGIARPYDIHNIWYFISVQVSIFLGNLKRQK